MGEQPYFVQFPHPGREHAPKSAEMGWNVGVHARKFMRATGTYLDGTTARTGSFTMWGEWEPPSEIVHRFDSPAAGFPRLVHRPILRKPDDAGWRQNTDPFVFGDHMLYSNCRQLRNHKLRELAPGSLVLFGSRLAGQFVLDTLLVVGSSQPLDIAGSSASDWPSAEWDCIVEPLTLDPALTGLTFRRYEGARYSGSIDEPFSFVPCLPWADDGAPFRRPAIQLDRKWITPGLTQAARATPASTDELASLWRQLRDQVEESSGLHLGVHIDLPVSQPPE
jgi:hypothetical protein